MSAADIYGFIFKLLTSINIWVLLIVCLSKLYLCCRLKNNDRHCFMQTQHRMRSSDSRHANSLSVEVCREQASCTGKMVLNLNQSSQVFQKQHPVFCMTDRTPVQGVPHLSSYGSWDRLQALHKRKKIDGLQKNNTTKKKKPIKIKTWEWRLNQPELTN